MSCCLHREYIRHSVLVLGTSSEFSSSLNCHNNNTADSFCGNPNLKNWCFSRIIRSYIFMLIWAPDVKIVVLANAFSVSWISSFGNTISFAKYSYVQGIFPSAIINIHFTNDKQLVWGKLWRKVIYHSFPFFQAREELEVEFTLQNTWVKS